MDIDRQTAGAYNSAPPADSADAARAPAAAPTHKWVRRWRTGLVGSHTRNIHHITYHQLSCAYHRPLCRPRGRQHRQHHYSVPQQCGLQRVNASPTTRPTTMAKAQTQRPRLLRPRIFLHREGVWEVRLGHAAFPTRHVGPAAKPPGDDVVTGIHSLASNW